MLLDIVSLVLLLGITYLAWEGKQEVESLEVENADLNKRLSTLELVSAHYFEFLQASIEASESHRHTKEKGPQE